MAEYFTGSPKTLFEYWQDENRAEKFLLGGTREAAIEFCRRFKEYFNEKTWVDIGTGTGYVVKRLLEDFKPRSILGIDISRAMLSKYQVSDATISLGSGLDMPLKTSSVEAVTSFFCFSDYPDLSPFISEAGRVLTQKGVFLYVDYAKGDEYWELRKKYHKQNGVVGNINLRTTEEIDKLLKIEFSPIISSYVTSEVDSKPFNVPFSLPQTIKRKFLVSLALKN